MLPAGMAPASHLLASAHARSRGGDKSSALFFSHQLELTRVPSGPCTPRLPAVEAPSAGAASGLRVTRCPAGWLGAATSRWCN